MAAQTHSLERGRISAGRRRRDQLVRIDAGGNDPVTGESFTDIAGRSRSMHKTQGFGNFTGGGGSGPRTESFSTARWRAGDQ